MYYFTLFQNMIYCLTQDMFFIYVFYFIIHKRLFCVFNTCVICNTLYIIILTFSDLFYTMLYITFIFFIIFYRVIYHVF